MEELIEFDCRFVWYLYGLMPVSVVLLLVVLVEGVWFKF